MPLSIEQSIQYHWRSHAKVSYHFTEIGEGVRNDAVKNTENNHKKLPESV